MRQALLDTSVLVALEGDRQLDSSVLPDEAFVCVVTIAELRAGVLAADDLGVRSRRLATFEAVVGLQPLPIDTAVAERWAEMAVRLREAGRRMGVNDLWIAAVAAANDMPVITHEAEFDVLDELGLVGVVHV